MTCPDGLTWFVAVDDLDSKDWLGDTREAVFDGLGRALSTAATPRDGAGLDFVAAPLPTRDGGLLRHVDDRYAVSVFPFLAGRSYRFGPYLDLLLRGRALDMIAALHQATPAVRGLAPPHVLGFTGRADLDSFLRDPGRQWEGGPFSESARHLLATRTAELAQLTDGFDRMAAATVAARVSLVITHGEPHPACLMSARGQLVLIDWDTAALAPPERDVSLIATTSGEGIERYQHAAGRNLDPASSPCTGRADTSPDSHDARWPRFVSGASCRSARDPPARLIDLVGACADGADRDDLRAATRVTDAGWCR